MKERGSSETEKNGQGGARNAARVEETVCGAARRGSAGVLERYAPRLFVLAS